MRRLTVTRETFPLAREFRIARGGKTAADVITVALEENGAMGRGECVPYARYGETLDSTQSLIESRRSSLEEGLSRQNLQRAMPAGAARNAIDCALWDLEAKLTGVPAWSRAGLPEPHDAMTAFTISLDTPEAMGRAAAAARNRAILKLKLGNAAQDLDRVAAVAAVAPEAALIADVNEGWTIDDLQRLAPALLTLGVTLIEQPIPAPADSALEGYRCPVPLCADESVHGLDTLAAVSAKYDVVNVKLDKTGGLTGALETARRAQELGLGVMIGCMVGTSLAMAPALLLAPLAHMIDLDGPLWLAQDRVPGLRYEGSTVHPPPPELWG